MEGCVAVLDKADIDAGDSKESQEEMVCDF